MRSCLIVSLLLVGALGAVAVAPAVAQSGHVGADAFEVAYLFVTREYLRPVPSRDLLQGAVAGLAAYLRNRGLPPQPITLSGQDGRDLEAVRAAVIAVGRRLGSAAAEREAGYAAIDGMLRVLGDPFTRLLLPGSGRGEVRPGGYSGVGVVLDLEVRPPVVVEVVEGSPAQRAGLRRGDLILEIDGRSTITMPPQEVVSRLRGLPGTSVVVRVRRSGGELTVTLVRELIGLRQTAFRLWGTVGYLRVEEFTEGAGEEVAAVAAELQRRGALGIILDLRGNPGGFLDEAVVATSVFLPQGPVTILVGRDGRRTRLDASAGGFKFTGPVAVLVDGRTASAAEMVAGALQDAGRLVVGRRTFGKGTVQELRRLPGGAVLQLTVAQYLTPSGVPVEGRGIVPQVEVETDEATFGTDEDPLIQTARRWLETRVGALALLAA
ncbi:MAG: S41 family peptidase [Armatimonadota bacterium]|nr:S41 family peptidase [Armatimonadota bacterium]MDR7427424.1 S41 family peptidase [Armatimonadota bacterium]MDR7470752.1 S41 family peptidase [Armatimonadota bacterium]MDR7475003.1 S41 family peptidase [Armatimonadota bacterium]MDR7539490.1 S41 family peptidase [Armatimonadota bacterium]